MKILAIAACALVGAAVGSPATAGKAIPDKSLHGGFHDSPLENLSEFENGVRLGCLQAAQKDTDDRYPPALWTTFPVKDAQGVMHIVPRAWYIQGLANVCYRTQMNVAIPLLQSPDQ